MVTKIQKPADVSDATVKGEPQAAAPRSVEADIDSVLSDLNQHAASSQGAAQQQEAKQERQQIDTVKADILDLLDLVAAPARPLINWLTDEQFEQLWGKKKREEFAEPLAAIARRHGWDMRGALSDYGPYAMLAASLGPSVYVTYKVRQQQKAYFAEQAAAAGGKGGDGSAST